VGPAGVSLGTAGTADLHLVSGQSAARVRLRLDRRCLGVAAGLFRVARHNEAQEDVPWPW